MLKKKKWVAVIRGEHWLVAKTAHRKNKLQITRLAEYSGTSVNQESLSAAAASEEATPVKQLKQWLQREKVPLKELSVAVSCSGVITRVITLPVLTGKELAKLLTEQVDQYFTFNTRDYIIDFRVLAKFEEDGQKRQQVLLAALPRHQWEKWWVLWEELGIKPEVVDLASDSLARLYARLETDEGLNKAKPRKARTSASVADMAVVDLNRERVEFVILEAGVFFLYSDLKVELSELEDARDFFPENVVESETEDWYGNNQGLNMEGEKRRIVEQALTPVFHELAEFLNFFAARHFGKTVDKIYLTGEYADIPFLTEMFEYNLEVPTQLGFPAGWRPHLARRLRHKRKDWMKYGSLYGLALRED